MAVVARRKCALEGMYGASWHMEGMVSCGGPTGRMVMVWEARPRRAGNDML